MAYVIVNHRVKDFSVWKPYFDSDKERRSAAGLTEIGVGKKAGDENMVYIIFQTDDPSSAEQMMRSDPDRKEKMIKAGVISQLETTILI